MIRCLHALTQYLDIYGLFYIVIKEQSDLIHEVEVLHRQFFRCDAPHELIDNYLRVHAELPDMLRANDIELHTVRIIIEKQLDALGIEPWLRSGSSRHLLTRKLLLISFLAECDADHPESRREVDGRAHSFIKLFNGGMSSGIHLLRGRFQKAIYGLF